MMLKIHSSWFIVQSILFFLALYAVLCTPYLVFAQSVSSTDLINNAQHYDGKTVVYAGEVIGDIMGRGGFAWINVKDNKNAIGIWIDKDLIKDISYCGGYKSRGDRIEIAGVFHRVCLQHGGDLDIHAQQLRHIKIGEEIPLGLNLSKRNLSFILLGGLCLALILRQLKIK